MKGSRALLKMLEDKGVETMFGYPGGAVIPIYDEILGSSVRHILTRHEQCAAHMADGYARATGRPGVCLATSGPGATNLVTGVGTAYADSIPMIALTGQVGTGSMGLGAFQEVDAFSLMMPVTKYNYRVLDLNQLPFAITQGWKLCQEGRPGPVHIDLPVDQMNAEIDESLLYQDYSPKERFDDLSQIYRAVSWIRESRRPVILAGGGAISSGCSEEVIKLAELIGAPVVTPLMGIGIMPYEHPLYLGPLGMHGRVRSLTAMKETDLVIAIGSKFSDRTYSAHTRMGSCCRVIQIDIDSAVFDKHDNTSVNILCDAKKGLDAILQCLTSDDRPEWRARIAELRSRCDCTCSDDSAPIIPQRVMSEINALIDDDTVITTDVGQNQMWAMHYLRIKRPRQLISSGSFGTMGFGLPSALGVKAALPEKNVMTITGDGGLLMVVQELATAVSEDLPVTICLLNNGWLGMVKQWQKLFWNEHYCGTKLRADPDFVKLAESFGAEGIRVDRPSEIRESLIRARECGKACIVEIMVDPEEDCLPMLPSNPTIPMVRGRCVF